jgi:hypothetical protein
MPTDQPSIMLRAIFEGTESVLFGVVENGVHSASLHLGFPTSAYQQLLAAT